jgi:3-phosphoshikimate 1-carboxyvinyltransferase
MIRALAAALLSRDLTVLHHPSRCDDALAALQVIRSLGADVEEERERWSVRGGIALREDILDVGESGLTARLFIPLASLLSQPMTITGRGSLMQRPMTMVEEPLRSLGVTVTTTGGMLPVTVRGPLQGGRAVIDGSKGSQFLTGLLMSLPLTQQDSVLEVNDLRSVPYIDLTLDMMRRFGVVAEHDGEYRRFRVPGSQEYHAAEITVEGDWSGGAFLLVAAALAGDIKITGLERESAQADRKILEALERAGVTVEAADDHLHIRQSIIKPFTFDITHCPDLAPPLVCLGAAAEGVSVLRGAGRLREKESDRAVTLQDLAGRLGVRIDLEGDEMVIHGGTLHGGDAEAHQDHRIAMAAAVMALRAPQPVTIHGAECVNKSYPEFFDDLEKLGGKVKNLDA